MTDGLSDQKGSKEAMGYGIGGQQSNTDKELDTVEVIERWETGRETKYSVDGGTHWWTKEQFKDIQSIVHRHQNQLLDKLLEEKITAVVGRAGSDYETYVPVEAINKLRSSK